MSDQLRGGTTIGGYLAWHAGNDGVFLKATGDNTIDGKLIASANNRASGMYGIYDSTKIGHIWSMGAAYAIAADGSTFGGLYGLAYKHTNNPTGGAMAGGHQVVWSQAGIPTCALGNGIWTSGIITGAQVFNAVWNDYAELFEKKEKNKHYEAGYIIELDKETGRYQYSTKRKSKNVIGVVSNSYGHLLGGEKGKSMEENLESYIPVGLSGRLEVFIKGRAKIGDLVTSSNIEGVGIVSRLFHKSGTIVGKVLENKNSKDIGKVKILILNK